MVSSGFPRASGSAQLRRPNNQNVGFASMHSVAVSDARCLFVSCQSNWSWCQVYLIFGWRYTGSLLAVAVGYSTSMAEKCPIVQRKYIYAPVLLAYKTKALLTGLASLSLNYRKLVVDSWTLYDVLWAKSNAPKSVFCINGQLFCSPLHLTVQYDGIGIATLTSWFLRSVGVSATNFSDHKCVTTKWRQ